jgi:hypothetical protein
MGPAPATSWTTEDGSARSVVEVVADELWPSLRWATATTTRATQSSSQVGSGRTSPQLRRLAPAEDSNALNGHRPLGPAGGRRRPRLQLRNDWGPHTGRVTSWARSAGWGSPTMPRSWASRRPTAALNAGSAPSRSSACGSSCTTPSRSCARPSAASSTVTTPRG